jgi:hypothetical protein
MKAHSQRMSRDVPDWLRPHLVWAVGSSWFFSALFHASAAVTIWYVAQTPGCQAVRGEQIGDGDGRDVGIFLRSSGEGGDGGEDGAADAMVPAEQQLDEPRSVAAIDPKRSALDAPPVELELPKDNGSVIGLGGAPSFAQQALENVGGKPGAGQGTGRGKPGRPGRPGGEGGAGGGGTSLFNVEAKGTKFVYVIDRSSSMDEVLPAAKGELMASLEALDENQRFQVVFFNNLPVSLRARHGMLNGTESDRLEALKQIREISADGGTRRLEALLNAFSFDPDVIYFLTDIGEPIMSAADLEDVRVRNRNRAQIHCIEFGVGPPATNPQGKAAPNFLFKLAEQSGGRYVYRDIQTLNSP